MLSFYPASISDPYNPKVSEGFEVCSDRYNLKFIFTRYLWSPIIWKGGHRRQANFLCAHYVGLDFENPDVSIEEIERKYQDSWHLLGTTRNHQKAKGTNPPMDRFRLLLKLERPITDLEEYKYNMKKLVYENGADAACVDGARAFQPCTELFWYNTADKLSLVSVMKGPTPEEIKARIEAAKARIALQQRAYAGSLPRYAQQWLMNEIPMGERNRACFKLGCMLYRSGMSYEDALEKILASPTYAGTALSSDLLIEIKRAVRSGYDAASRKS